VGERPLNDHGSGMASTVDGPGPGFSVGGRVGGRYEVRGLLGRRGMGEVWRAFDLKLRVEVALKALREELYGDERRRELLHSEVRAAREVVSPNVCRVFDLVEAFAAAMTSLATRRRRRRRVAAVAAFVDLAGVLAVVGTSLRRTRAALERTDASRLVALGRSVGAEADPIAVLAYGMASLERADSLEARMLALDAVAHGPIRCAST